MAAAGGSLPVCSVRRRLAGFYCKVQKILSKGGDLFFCGVRVGGTEGGRNL